MADIRNSSLSLDALLQNDNYNANSTTLQECPQCNSKVQWFMLNFEERILMCVNEKCVFPLDCIDNIVVGPINATEEPVIPTKQITKTNTKDSNPTMNVHTFLNSADVKIIKRVPGKTRLEKCLETSAKVTDILCAKKKKGITEVTDPKLLKKLFHLEKVTNKCILTPGELEKLSKVEDTNIDFEIQMPTGSDQMYKIDFRNNKDQLELT